MINKQTSYSFQPENLTPDWIRINIEGNINIKPIIHYLEKLNFIRNESYIGYQMSEIEQNNSCCIRQMRAGEKPDIFWTGTQIDFPGKSASAFYSLLKEKKIDFNIFSVNRAHQVKLGRFDLCYNLETETLNKDLFNFEKVSDFLASSFKKTALQRRNVRLEYSESGLILKIGNRKSANFFRVYQNGQAIRFELERKKINEHWQNLFFGKHFRSFEARLFRAFNLCVKKYLLHENDSIYTQWFTSFIRQYRDQPIADDELVITFLKQRKNFCINETEHLYRIFQLLSFVRSKQNLININDLENQSVEIEFKLNTLLEFMGHDPKSKYRKAQATKFLKQFYNKSYILENVSDEVFCGFWKNWKKKYIDDYCRIEKDIVKMRLAKELLQYKYPFKFPRSFLQYKQKYDLRIKFRLIQLISIHPTQKVLSVSDWEKDWINYNRSKKKVKQGFLKFISDIQESSHFNKDIFLMDSKGHLTKVTSLYSVLPSHTEFIILSEDIFQNINIEVQNLLL